MTKKLLLSTVLALMVSMPAFAASQSIRSVEVEGAESWELTGFKDQYAEVNLPGMPKAMTKSVVRFRGVDDRCASVEEYFKGLDRQARVIFIDPAWDQGHGVTDILVTAQIEIFDGETVTVTLLTDAIC